MYGLTPRPITYDDYVALHLSIPRQRDRLSALVSDAVAVGNGSKTAPDQWYEETASTPHEAAQWIAQDRTARLLQSMRQS